ncbi:MULTISPECIES: DNA polymerase [unclassified Streptomyces]|uniref:DNA polymerase n=1 Tax=unclassified Streptomyces TaxID=2593676 RepID=UPI0033EF7EA9
MKIINYKIKTDLVRINVVEDESDLPEFHRFVEANHNALGFDTETDGLSWWEDGFRIRLAQFGNEYESYVLPTERGGQFREDAIKAVGWVRKLIMQNGTYDILCMDKVWGIKAETVFPRLLDSRIIAHLVDSRGRKDGGVGHSLEELTRHYLSAAVADEVKGSMTTIAKELRVKKAEVWPVIPLEHEGFNLYAGMDPVLAYRLAKLLKPKIPATARKLLPYEHELAAVCAYMVRKGIKADVPYVQDRANELARTEVHFKEVAARLGLENINSPKQVGEAIVARGITITERTPTGQPKVDDHLLKAHIDDPLCEAIYQGKRAAKAKSTWFDNALNNRDSDDRLHAAINSMGARTARMSISGAIPAQTFPSGDSLVRRGFIADEGMTICAVDYKAQELRVLAALSGDKAMKRAFREGADLHQITADSAGVDRSTGKMAGFLTVYGGGWAALASQAGVSEETARRAIDGFFAAFPRVKEYSEELQKEARRNGYITTITGRRLLVDKRRPYAALNYAVQSASRDVTGRAILRLHEAGYGPWMLLPVHDEVIFQFPTEHALKATTKAAQIMKDTMSGVLIDTDVSVYGKSWGCGYMAEGQYCDLCDIIHQEEK